MMCRFDGFCYNLNGAKADGPIQIVILKAGDIAIKTDGRGIIFWICFLIIVSMKDFCL